MPATPGRRISSTLRNANRALALGPSLASAVEESQEWRAGAGLLGPERDGFEICITLDSGQEM